jgi:glycosyltransferase involved in cell wall biosynthesis
MKISFVIPCLNEAETIVSVVKQATVAGHKNFALGDFEILVADNGSDDGSVEKLTKLVKSQKGRKKIPLRIIHVPVRGYGAALHWGIMKARGKYVMYADADCSYDFREVKVFLPVIKNADLVLGSRLKGNIDDGAMPFLHQYLGTPVLTFLIRILYHLPVSDCNSGMRVVRKSFYAKLHMHNSGMEWASELLIKTALHQGKYHEVPITLHLDERRRPPHLLSWIDGWRHLKAIILLKPNALFIVVIALLFLGVGIERLAFFFFLAAFGLTLSTLAAKLLQFAIDGTSSWGVQNLQKLPIVSTTIFLNVAVVLALIFLQKIPMEMKLIFSCAMIVIDVWIFHIETIKTHVMYRLPDRVSLK